MDVVALFVALACGTGLDSPSYRARESARCTLERLPSTPVALAFAALGPVPSAEAADAMSKVRLRHQERLFDELYKDDDAFIRYAVSAPVSERPWRMAARLCEAHIAVRRYEDETTWYWSSRICWRLEDALKEAHPGKWSERDLSEDDIGFFRLPGGDYCYSWSDPSLLILQARLGTNGESLSIKDW